MSVNLKIGLNKFQYTGEVEQIYGLSRKIFILVSFFSKRISLTPTTLTNTLSVYIHFLIQIGQLLRGVRQESGRFPWASAVAGSGSWRLRQRQRLRREGENGGGPWMDQTGATLLPQLPNEPNVWSTCTWYRTLDPPPSCWLLSFF